MEDWTLTFGNFSGLGIRQLGMWITAMAMVHWADFYIPECNPSVYDELHHDVDPPMMYIRSKEEFPLGLVSKKSLISKLQRLLDPQYKYCKGLAKGQIV